MPFFVTIRDRETVMTYIKSIARLGAIAALMSLATGCASVLSIGSPKYACSGLPEGAACQSTRDIYEATHDGNVPLKLETKEEFDSKKKTKRSKKAKQAEAEKQAAEAAADQVVERDTVIDNYVAPRLPDRPIPIRTPAEVMRIWVAPWEDVNGDLVTNGYIYTEIEPRRWVIGQQGAAEPTVLKPLQTIGSTKQKPQNQE